MLDSTAMGANVRDSNPEDARRKNRRPDELSALDKRIIEHLQEDGRRPFTQIATALGVSEAAVRARTNRLVERGILQIVGVADLLLSPLRTHTSVPVTTTAAPSASPEASPSPAKSPAPSRSAKPTKSAKPSKSPG